MTRRNQRITKRLPRVVGGMRRKLLSVMLFLIVAVVAMAVERLTRPNLVDDAGA